MYENRYREYLDNKRFYQQHLQNKGEPQYASSLPEDFLAAAGLLGGGYLLYERGYLKHAVSTLIQTMSRFRPGAGSAIMDGFTRLARHPAWEGEGNILQRAMRVLGDSPHHFQMAFSDQEIKERLHHGKTLTDRPLEVFEEMVNLNKVHEKYKDWKGKKIVQNDIDSNRLDKQLLEDMHRHFQISQEQRSRQLRQTGHRHATLQDLIDKHLLTREQQAQVRSLQTNLNMRGLSHVDVTQWRADAHVLISEKGRIADVREFRHSIGKFVDSAANDFGLPLVHFNPLKLFYLDNLTTMHRPPLFTLLHPNTRNPLLTHHNGVSGVAHLFSAGHVYELTNLAKLNQGPIMKNAYLVSAKGGVAARLIRNLAGIPMKTFSRPTKGWFKKLRYDAADALELNLQDEPIRRYQDDFGDRQGVDLAAGLGDAVSWVGDKFWKHFPLMPKESITKQMGRLEEAFGGKEAEWLVMRGYQPLNESNSFRHYMQQFEATRKELDKVTTGTLFGYAFFERLNAALNSVGLGLHSRSLGSGFDIAKSLVLKRMLPLAVGIEGLKYLDYSSSFLLGEPFSHKFAEFYQDQSVMQANLRDELGITDWAKQWSGVFVGGDQITELPLVGHLFDLDDNKEETKQYWETGMDPVRKGRWWDLGNTPFTGAKVDYYRPNWVRETLADINYSDNTYGSREEYWAHSWLPTPTHPLAPIRHFLTDPYWYERKHYEDRPYLVTGGIPEIAEIPMVGGILNDTVGQLLKPQKAMHTDWKQEQGQEDTLRYSRNTVDTVIPAVVDPGNYSRFYGTASAAAGGAMTDPAGYNVPLAVPIGVPGADLSALPSQPEGQTVAYSTTDGAIQVMELSPGVNLAEINQKIKENGIQRTGKSKLVNLPGADPDITSLFASKPDPMDPLGIQMSLGNLHYNLGEVGGFYGFASNMITGELYDDAPVVQDSNRATSYERAFWDQDIGGIGGEANEIFRRFLPHRRHQINEFNPIRNEMPSWMPGKEYYQDFQHGDPYVKVKLGEERLPGDAYEKLWGLSDPMEMSIGASYIGKDQASIIEHLLKRKELDMEDADDILTYGEDFHKKMQSSLTQAGIMIDYEQHVTDKKNAVNGFYDGRVHNEKFVEWAQQNAGSFGLSMDLNDQDYAFASASGANYDQLLDAKIKAPSTAIIEMKTMGDKMFHSGDIKPEHLAQLNFYMGQTNNSRGYLVYFNRDNPDEKPTVKGYDYDPELYKKSIANLEGARRTVHQMIDKGLIGPGDLYPMVDRLRILADVAPYSDNYRSLRDQIGKTDLTDKEKAEVQDIRHRVAEAKKFTRMYDYRFATAHVKHEGVTVTDVIKTPQSYMFLTKEHPDNPIKLAGLRVPMGKDDPTAQAAHKILDGIIHPGAELNLLVDEDPQKQINNDTYETISAVVESGPLGNLNRELIRKGLAKEKDTDNSAPGIYARYTATQRNVGTLWESLAHMDTIINTKWLQVRSPAESYERREVWGKDWQDWNTPVESFLKPLVWSSIHAGPLAGAMGGGILGWMMGRNRFGRIVGATIGTLLGGSEGVYGTFYKWTHGGHPWIPEERRKEWDATEYLDTLRFVKDQRLFNHYAQLAKSQEHFDVVAYIKKLESIGEHRKQEMKTLEKLKKELRIARSEEARRPIRREIRSILKESVPGNDEDLLHALNARIKELSNSRQIQRIGKYGAKALEYYKDSKQTMYGDTPGGPLEDILSALPKKDREYLHPFMEAPKDERQKILDETPIYLRRTLEATWGLPVEEKPDLPTYFSQHELPDANWVGWDERVNLDDVKVKLIQKEALDQSEFDVWQDDKERANREYIKTPNLYTQEHIKHVESKLRHILGKNGIADLDVQVERTQSGRIDVDLQIAKDRRDEIRRQLNEDGTSLFS